MKTKVYIVSIPSNLTIDTILVNKPELRTYIEDLVDDQSYIQLEEILKELKANIETEIVGNISRQAIMYYLIEYIKDSNQLLGEIGVPGNIEKLINVEAEGVKECTKDTILQHGLLDGIMRRLNGS